jgi:pyruvate dehydrogenase E1 component beta subunit
VTVITYREAVARGIAQEMRRDDRVVFLGEDVAAAGGVFKATVGLLEEFGPQRVRDTPISEQAILGAAMGAAMTGLRPVAEIMFSDFFAVCWDLVANEIAKSRYMSAGQVSFPLVVRAANGAGVRFGAQHSQSVENWAMAVPGLKVVAPSSPHDQGPRSGAVLRAEVAVRDQGGRGGRRDLRTAGPGEGAHRGRRRHDPGTGRHGPTGARRGRPALGRARHRL